MTEPLELFPARSRSSDPRTSKQAAAAQRSGVIRAVLIEHERAPWGLTDEELCSRLAQFHAPTVVSARSRLKNAGKLRDTGGQRPNGRGMPMIVWKLT